MSLNLDLHGKGDGASVDPALPGRNSTRFMKYLAWLERAHGYLLERSGANTPLFPSALPYPEVLGAKGRARGSLDALQWGRVFVNTLVAWSNFVVLGCPDGEGSAFEPRVAHTSVEGIRPYADKLSSALPVVADRVAIPEEVVDNLQALRRPEHLWGEEVQDGRLLLGGLFAVRKNEREAPGGCLLLPAAAGRQRDFAWIRFNGFGRRVDRGLVAEAVRWCMARWSGKDACGGRARLLKANLSRAEHKVGLELQ